MTAPQNVPAVIDATPTQRVRAALRAHYGVQTVRDLASRSPSTMPGACVVLEEVQQGAGVGSRSIDLLVVHCWRSEDFAIDGFEIKASRQDWKRELQQPYKGEGGATLCDRWWLAIAERGIAKIEELPEGWGLMVLGPNGGMETLKRGAKKEPSPVSRAFFAAVCRRVVEQSVDQHMLDEAVAAGYRAGWENAERANINLAAARKDLQQLRRSAKGAVRFMDGLLRGAPVEE